MSNKFQRIFIKTVVFLASELLLNYMGTDIIADYSEFVFEIKFVKTIKEYPEKIAFPLLSIEKLNEVITPMIV